MNEIVIEILGSGGATTTPKPLCNCAICREAREKGGPYTRTGPSVFIHGPDILIDTPEESKQQIERAGIRHIAAGFYSHWHPDHTLGCRIWDMNGTHRGETSKFSRTTPIYMAENIIKDFGHYYGLAEHFQHREKLGYIKTHIAPLGEAIAFGNTNITPFPMAEKYVAGFEIHANGKKAIIVMDESSGWNPNESQKNANLVIMPVGVMEFHPLNSQRLIRENHGILKAEPTFDKVLERARDLRAKKIILSHISEADQVSYGDLLQVQENLNKQGMPIEFAYDGMKIAL